jgi:hypothetical protein
MMIKRAPLEIPPAVARSFLKDLRAFHAEQNAVFATEEAANRWF